MFEEERLVEQAVETGKAIMAPYSGDVIKKVEITPVTNTETGEKTGFGVVLQLSTAYDYDKETFDSWQRMLNADDWYINVRRIQLHIHFKVRNKEK